MSLKPIDERHAAQIQAGLLGRQTGHKFEDTLASRLNSLLVPLRSVLYPAATEHVFIGSPEASVLRYICARESVTDLKGIVAL